MCHQPGNSDAALQSRLKRTVLIGLALRQTIMSVESLLRLIGLAWAVPYFGTQSPSQKALKVNIPCRGSDGPLHLPVHFGVQN